MSIRDIVRQVKPVLEKNSIDFYASVKSLYLQDRQQKILNVKKIIETQNDSDWEEIEDQQ